MTEICSVGLQKTDKGLNLEPCNFEIYHPLEK